MPMDLYKKIIDEAATIPRIEEITLTGLGEPLLDRHVVERIKYTRSKLPGNMKIDMFTNGTYLTEKMARDLKSAGLSVIYVSLNAVNADKRRQIMKLDDFDMVVAQIRKAMEIGGKKMQVIAKGIVSKDLMEIGESELFLTTWGGDFKDGGKAFLHLEGNWAGSMWDMRVIPSSACARALSQIMVLWDGRVSLCCFDGEGDITFGDLNNQTLREIYGSDAFTDYRRAHIEGKRNTLKMCNNCTAI